MGDIVSFIQHHVVPFIVTISIVVFVHEFGHYWVARRCGVRVLVFSIGFGREIFGWNDKHGTRWKVSWLPLGGYVRMFGDADPASSRPDPSAKDMTQEDRKVAFFSQNLARRAAIVVAGPASNYVFAIIVCALLFTFIGQAYAPPDIGDIVDKGAAQAAGLMKGDHIDAMDGHPVKNFDDIKLLIEANDGAPMKIDVTRDGKPMQFMVTPQLITTTDRFGNESKDRRIGIVSTKTKYEKRGPAEAIKQAFVEPWNITVLSLTSIWQMILGTRSADELGGPLRIAQLSGEVAEDGTATIIHFLAVISVSLGFINLFPIMPLDGGLLALYFIEFLKRKPLSPQAQEISANIGIAFIVVLLLFATWNDLVYLKILPANISDLFS